jgi:tetratricopeptide (TPR) repeat protein
MGRDDWYRNTTWDADIGAQFSERLGRARQKSQYLRIQASMLADRRPDVALRLLDQYFSLGDHFDHAQAYVDRAKAQRAIGNVKAAIESYEDALSREAAYPRLLTQAYLELPCLIADLRLSDRYARALDVLDASQDRLMFASDRYLWNGARALIFFDRGDVSRARVAAKLALSAASESHSAFRYHPRVGLVDPSGGRFDDRLAAIARGVS